MTSTLETKIETKGPDTFAVLVPQFESVSTISEIQTARLSEEELETKWFYCGNGAVYGLKEDDVILYLTNFANNPIMKDPVSAAQELKRNQNFLVNPQLGADLETRASSGDGVTAFKLSELPLHGGDLEFRYIEVSTSKLAEGRDAFKAQYGDKVTALFDKVHGSAIYGEDGIGARLVKKNKETTRIYFLNPEYVKSILKEKEKGAMIARASFLDVFGCYSNVDLGSRLVDDGGHVHGVVKKTAEGGVQNIMPYDEALKKLQPLVPSQLHPQLQITLNEIYRVK